MKLTGPKISKRSAPDLQLRTFVDTNTTGISTPLKQYRFASAKLKRLAISSLKRLIVLIHAPATLIWRNIDRLLAWPDVWHIINQTPTLIFGGVGGDSYTGWVYQQGYFASLLKAYTISDTARILDFGCGFGKLAAICAPFVAKEGSYTGIDISPKCIDYCHKKYAHLKNTRFFLSNDFNARYSSYKKARNSRPGDDWPITGSSIDTVVAVSVFTHLQENDAYSYIDKIYKVLKSGGVAILTFHILTGEVNTPKYTSPIMPFHRELFTFKYKIAGSGEWFTSFPDNPEIAIGVKVSGIEKLFKDRFRIEQIIRGSTTGGEDLYFQDVVIARKC